MNEAALVRVQIIDRYSSALARMNKMTTAFRLNVAIGGEALTKFGAKAGMISTKLANLRTGFLAMMSVRGLKSVATESYEFEKALNKVRAVTQALPNDMVRLREEARKLGLETKFSALQAAQGMTMLGQRGFDTQKILSTLPSVLTMATAGDLDLAAASKMVTGTMYAFGMNASKAAHIADVYALTAARTASDMNDLNSAMINAAPLAAAAGIEFEELAALVGVMSNKNIMGSQSGTLLMNAFRNLIVPSREAIETLMKFGFKKNEITDASGKIVDFTRVLELFQERGIGVGEIFKIFQIRGAKATAAMMGTHDAVRVLRAELEKNKGAADEMSRVMLSGIVGTAVEAKSSFEGLKEAIGKAIEPATEQVLKMVTAMNRFIASHPKLAKLVGVLLTLTAVVLTIVTVIGVIAAAIAGIATVVGMFAGAAIASTAVAVVAGIIAGILIIVSLIVAMWDDWITTMKMWGEYLAYYSKLFIDKIKKMKTGAILLVGAFNPMIGVTLLLIKHWERIGEIWDGVRGFLGFGKTELKTSIASPGNVGTTSTYRKEETIQRMSLEILAEPGVKFKTNSGGNVPINRVNTNLFPGGKL
jgi:TP901 family phage tail tape measure protein